MKKSYKFNLKEVAEALSVVYQLPNGDVIVTPTIEKDVFLIEVTY